MWCIVSMISSLVPTAMKSAIEGSTVTINVSQVNSFVHTRSVLEIVDKMELCHTRDEYNLDIDSLVSPEFITFTGQSAHKGSILIQFSS